MLTLCFLIAVSILDFSEGEVRVFRSPFDAWHAVPFTTQTDAPSSTTTYQDDFLVHHNLWFHNQRYYRITEASSPEPPKSSAEQLAQNTGVVELPVRNAATFYSNLEGHWLEGVTLLVDFAVPAYPDSMGHWAEIMVPYFCILSSNAWQQAVGGSKIDQIIFTNMNHNTLERLDWIWQMWKVVLSPLQGRQNPRLLFWADLDDVDRQHWLCIEHLVVANDRYMHPSKRSGFWSSDLGQSFRAAAYRLLNLDLPEQPARTITFLGGVSGEEVVNQLELIEHLEDIASALEMKVRPYTATPEAPFASFLAAMARTGVLVSRHGPLLTNAMFLPPGAVVVELLPYHWEWQGTSMLYKNLTASIGDIHHFAWRARHVRHALYATADDARYSEWAAEECMSPECLEIHAKTAMLADCGAVQELLNRVLPDVLRGKQPAEIEQPWPSVAPKIATAQFSWDRAAAAA